MNTRVMTAFALLGWSLSGLVAARPAHADYLVGAYLFAATSDGTTGNTIYQYDTNSSDPATPLNINGSGKSIGFALPTGSTSFSFDQALNTALSGFGTNGDLGLFFSTTDTPYDPTTSSRTPDLLVSRDITGTLAFFTPTAGTSINDYDYVLGGPPSLSANGATTFTLGTSTISVSDYSVADKPNGTFTLSVVSLDTPEPGSLALLSGLGLSGAVFALRRRRK